ncbi:ABC transporter ATP-binding protein [Streptomyces yanii]|uniref:Spermidine/putrescine import ATP-binding protein PotA n=1 Tax=Streptomyces yanii TaxID=78510 RepID=A0ABV5RHW1_9ACTN
MKTEMPAPNPGPTRSGRLELSGLAHDYGLGVRAVDDVDITIEPGEFFTLLGASGSGKSTILQLVAGLLDPSGGRILLDGKDITGVSPQRRDVGMVFQSYALFPHMTVRQNIAFPLEVRKAGKQVIEERVEEMLRLVELTDHRDKNVAQLSGGQQQRVAIARSLAAVPRVLLLDEPLGALDKRLREQLSAQLREVQERAGVTAIYVTHDQVEAFTMSDRVAVLDRGKLIQVGTPEELYHQPRNRFVAEFVGDANVVAGRVRALGSQVAYVETGDGRTLEVPTDRTWAKDTAVALIVRPENVVVRAPGDDNAGRFVRGRVRRNVFVGDSTRTIVDADGATYTARVPGHAALSHVGDEVDLCWREHGALLVSDDSADDRVSPALSQELAQPEMERP